MKKLKWYTTFCLMFSYLVIAIQPIMATSGTNNNANLSNPILWSAIGGIALGIIGAVTYVNYIKKKRG